MSKTKKFGIGHGVTIVADHYGIRAEWFTDEAKKCRRSIGISWPGQAKSNGYRTD